MLVPFVIDIDSIAPDPQWTHAQTSIYHRSLFKVWQKIGILRHDSDKIMTSNLYKAIEKLPQKFRPLWMEMLENNPLLSCKNEWDGNITPENINQLDGVVKVALIDDTHAEANFELSEDGLFAPVAPTIEVCRISAAAHANTFEYAIERSAMHIQPNENYKDIWAQRFKILACAPIKDIVIVDRYSIVQLFNPPHGQLSGLDRFLRLLDADASGSRHITLYSSWADLPKEIRIDNVKGKINMILDKLEKKNINLFEIFMLPNRAFKTLAHDRFIRFGNFVWEIGIGLKVFQGLSASERSSATFKTGQLVVKEFKNIEDELKKHLEAKFTELKP